MNSEQAEEVRQTRSRRPKRVKFWVTFVVLVLLATGSLFAWRSFNMPVEGTITPPKVPHVPSAVQLQTTYFETKYPARYQKKTVPSQQSASLGAWVLVAQQDPGVGQSSRINLTVTTLPVGGVTEDSAYKLFTAEPQYYTLSQSKLGDDPVTIAVRNDPTYQKTILWPHGNYLLTISMLTANEQDQAKNDLQTVLANLHWLK
jgi:hypothetical protein